MGMDLHFTKHFESKYQISRFQIDIVVYQQSDVSEASQSESERRKKFRIFFLGAVDSAYLIDKLISAIKAAIIFLPWIVAITNYVVCTYEAQFLVLCLFHFCLGVRA